MFMNQIKESGTKEIIYNQNLKQQSQLQLRSRITGLSLLLNQLLSPA